LTILSGIAFIIGYSPIPKRVATLMAKTGSTPIYRHSTSVNIGPVFRRTEDKCIKERIYNIWKVLKAFINLLQAGLESHK
jgi:hypothetical protein